ncbi:MAG TPA: ATP-binding protein [Oscillatoriaceae cyanobacterium]
MTDQPTHPEREEPFNSLDNDLMRAILDFSPEVVFVRGLDGKLLYANPSFHRLFGVASPGMIGRTLDEFIPSEQAAALMASDQEAIAQARPIRVESDIVTADGPRTFEATKYPLVGPDGAVRGVIGISRDITERRRAERLLDQAEAIAELGSWEFDARTDTIIWSPQQYRLFEMSPDEPPLAMEAFLKRVHPDDHAHILALFATAEDNPEPIVFHFRIIRRDGSVRLIEALAQAEVDDNGALKRIIGTDRDITEERQAEQALREQSRQLEAANRRLQEADRAKTDLVNAASHDLRTPLMTILGISELLEDEVDGPLTERQRDDVRQIALTTKRLGRLVDDLLDFALVQAGLLELKCKPVDFKALIADEVALFALKIRERRFTVNVALDEPLPPVTADAQRVGRALMNLLSNAFKYTPAGGTITIAARSAGGAIKLSVQDTGVGIPAEHLARLFERFYQVSGDFRPADGVGLGLSIVAAVAQAHGGGVGVESQPGVGSTFWFTLPARA